MTPTFLFGFLYGISALLGPAPQLGDDEAEAIRAIKKLGGSVETDSERPDQGVVSVHLDGAVATDTDLRLLKTFKNLRSLSLRAEVSKIAIIKNGPPRVNGRITDAGLAELKDLENLEGLDLFGQTHFSDAGFQELTCLPNLQYLNLSITHVSDTGLRELSKFKKLRSLELRFTRFSEVGLRELQNVKSLKFLRLGNNGNQELPLARDAVDALQAALPELEIARDDIRY